MKHATAFGSHAALAAMLAGWSALGCQALLDNDYEHPCKGVAVGQTCPAFAAGAGGSTANTSTTSGPSGGGAGGGSGAGGSHPACKTSGDCPGGPNGHPTCDQETCGFQCDSGYSDCDGKVGCELPTSNDPKNCGACGTKCGAYCVDSACNDPVFLSGTGTSACAVLMDGSLWCWGAHVGDGTGAISTKPKKVALPSKAIEIAAGDLQTCAVLEGGALACWGDNSHGQLGLGPTAPGASDTPGVVALPNVAHAAVGGGHSCAVDTANELFCWGDAFSGQLGNGSAGDPTADQYSPIQIAPSVVEVTCGSYHTCALYAGGSVSCWGKNDQGQDGLSASTVLPTAGFLQGVTHVSAMGSDTSCALNALSMYCWGSNAYGTLGIGTVDSTAHFTPTPVNLPSVAAILPGGAIASGQAYRWGYNFLGELGDGTVVDKSSPVAISIPNPTQLTNQCALTDHGVVLCWGNNATGSLGDGTTFSRSTPAPVVWP